MSNFISPDTVSPTAYESSGGNQIVQLNFTDIAQQAYRLAGGLRHAGQGWSPSESQEALTVANAMINGWAIENLLIMFYIRTVVQLELNKKIYGVGPGQDWDLARPEKIHSAGFILNQDQENESELQMEIVLSYEQYANMIAKNLGGSIPLVLYYQPTLPYGSATIWPVYNGNGPNTPTSIALYTQGVLQEFSTIDDPLYLALGWREMLMYNLAVRIHQRPPYNKMPMDPSVGEMAIFYKKRVKDQQVTPIFMSSDAAVRSPRTSPTFGFPKAWVPYRT